MISRRSFLAALVAVPAAGVAAWQAAQPSPLGSVLLWVQPPIEPGAFIQAMHAELNSLLKDTQRVLDRQFYHDGQRLALNDGWADAEIRRFQRERW